MKKEIEQKYIDELPDIKEIDDLIKTREKQLEYYQKLSEDASTPKPIREHYKEYRIPHIEESIMDLSLARGMYIKGYIMGKRSKETPEERLARIIFDDEE